MEVTITAHVPGLVARVEVNEGQSVTKGQVVVIINFMKTEISVESPENGVVKSILVKEYDELQVGSSMIILDTQG